MNEKSSAEFDKTFWNLVVDIAASNEEVKTVVEWIFINDLKDISIATEIYERMGELLLETYGLPEHLNSQVINQCENNMVERTVS